METNFFSNLKSVKYPSSINHEDPTSLNNSESMLQFFSMQGQQGRFSFKKKDKKKGIVCVHILTE
jgi:hypothetical protein